jgi:phytoene dehydrogenase-like protein
VDTVIDGVWYPVGSFGKVGEALAEVAQKAGAKIYTNVLWQALIIKMGR